MKGKVEKIAKIWLTTAEMQEYLGVSQDTIQRMRNSGEISFSKFGNTIWHEKESVDSFIRRHRVV